VFEPQGEVMTMGSKKPNPNPVRRMGDRNVLCPDYNSCLDFAANQKWRTFCCDRCVFQANKYIPAPHELDLQPYLALIATVLGGPQAA
jgi:hypothetical protein